MPRGVFLLGLGLLLVAGAFVVTDALTTPAPGVTEENCDRIRKGMTLANVRAILGGPASQVVDLPGAPFSGQEPPPEATRWLRIWTGEGVAVQVNFSAREVVTSAWWSGPGVWDVREARPRPDPFDRLRKDLGR